MILRFDYINRIPLGYDYVKIAYGFFINEVKSPDWEVEGDRHIVTKVTDLEC